MSSQESGSELLKKFGERVKAFRQDRAITQDVLAHKAGLHRTYVADVERGRRNLSLQAISKLADALGIPITELFSHEESAAARRYKPFSFSNRNTQ